MKTISIDFDGTLTDIPEALSAMVASLRTSGHRVIVTTRRYKTDESAAEVDELLQRHSIEVDRIIFAGPLSKRMAVASIGESVDIWVDDKPESIVQMLPIRTTSQLRKPHGKHR